MKGFFKFVLKLGLLAGVAVVALQFKPVRDFAKELGLPV